VQKDGSRYVFLPDSDLESGIQYEARLEGGEDGVQARDGGAHLGGDHWWRFSTILDLEFRNNSDDVDPLEVHVYQTVRNAPLITEKPTAIRIYPYWEEHDDIHPDWQPTSFPFELDLNVVTEAERRVEPQFGGTATTEEIRLHRPDQFTDEHKRQAQHTINVYGWFPADGGPSEVEARLSAHDPYPAPLDPAHVIAERTFDIWSVDPDPLVLHVAFATVGAWADGVPSAEWLIADATVRAAAEFAQQILPVREVRTTFTNVEVSRRGKGSDPMVRLLADLRNSPYLAAQPQDVFVVVFPAGIVEFSGGNLRHRGSDEPGRGVILNIVESADNGMPVPISMQAATLVHEILHHHGLVHNPADADDLYEAGLSIAGFADLNIEGFRIAADGMAGWNKSYQECNAEFAGPPAPIMWPNPLDGERVWINYKEYQSLMNYMSR
jgi:hypothetical protein